MKLFPPNQNLSESELLALAEYSDRLEQLHRNSKFHSKQKLVHKAIYRDGYKRIFIRKGRKGGGTQTILYPVLRETMRPNALGYIIGPTAVLQKEVLWDNGRLINYIPQEWKPRILKKDGVITFPWGGRIKIDGANEEDRLRGREGDIFVFDELKDQDENAYENCYPNLAARDAILIVLGTPPETKNSFYYQLEERIRKDPEWYFIHWTIWDNEFLPGGHEWIRKEKARYYAEGKWDLWEREYEARYVFGGKRSVFPMFDSDTHMVPWEVLEAEIRDKRKLRWFTVCDPGFSTCFAVLFAAINPYTSQIFILDEIYETDRRKLSINLIWPRIQAIEQRLNPSGRWNRIYDSAAPGFPQEVRSRWGKDIRFQPTIKHKDDEDRYFLLMNSIFGREQCCLINQKCRNMKEELEDYITGSNGEYPDEKNHLLDDFRYLLKGARYKLVERPDDVIIKSERVGFSPEDDIMEAKEDVMMTGDSDIDTLGGLGSDISFGDFDL